MKLFQRCCFSERRTQSCCAAIPCCAWQCQSAAGQDITPADGSPVILLSRLAGGERASLGSEARLWKHEVSCKAKKVPLAGRGKLACQLRCPFAANIAAVPLRTPLTRLTAAAALHRCTACALGRRHHHTGSKARPPSAIGSGSRQYRRSCHHLLLWLVRGWR